MYNLSKKLADTRTHCILHILLYVCYPDFTYQYLSLKIRITKTDFLSYQDGEKECWKNTCNYHEGEVISNYNLEYLEQDKC